MNSVLLLDARSEELAAALRLKAPALQLGWPDSQALERFDIWLGEPDAAVGLLQAGYRPKWLQSTWAGFAPLLQAGLAHDYRLSRAVGLFGQPIAEYALSHILAHEQQLTVRRSSQDGKIWDIRLPGTLRGRRLLIVGAGDIGHEVAVFFKPFGVHVQGIVNRPRDIPPFDLIAGMAQLCPLASNADYILNLLPDTPQTQDIFDADFFASLRATAVFINAGRGGALVEPALINSLAQGRLAGAVLDVFKQEPLPADHPFWDTPGLTITGHIAGPWVTDRLVELFLQNLQHFKHAQPLRGEVALASL